MALRLPRLYSSSRLRHFNSKLANVSVPSLTSRIKLLLRARRLFPNPSKSSIQLKHQLIETSLKQQTPPLTAHYRHFHSTITTRQTNRQQLRRSPLESSILSRSLLVGLISVGGLAVYLSTMSSKLVPTHPSEVMVIRNVTPNVVALSVPFARFGVLKVGGRGTVGQCPLQATSSTTRASC